MKKLLTAAAFVALSSATAMAADLAVKAPMMAPAPIFSWTGFYVGGHVGGGWGTTETSVDVGNVFVGAPVNQTLNQLIGAPLGLNLPVAQTQKNGFIGGAQAGYNWQAGMFVMGVEGDITWSGIKGTSPCLLLFNCTSETKWIADLTGRLGVTVGDRGLLYVKGGVAWADSQVGINQSIVVGGLLQGNVNGSVSNTRIGGTLGAGVEYAVTRNWSVKLEYDYFDFGKKDLVIPITASGGIVGGPAGAIGLRAPINVNEQLHTMRIGANYRF